VVKLPVKAFLVTLATMSLIRGIAIAVSGDQIRTIQVNSNYFWIQVLFSIIVVGFSSFVLFRNYGIIDEGNKNVSSLKNDNMSILYYLLSAFSAVIVGIFLSFRMRSGQPTAGSGYEVDAIIVAILGGAICGYAAINLVSTIGAALLLAMLVNFLNLMNMGSSVQMILKIVLLFIGFVPIIIKGIMAPQGSNK
jgi:ribose transport system permease protein